MCFSPLLFRFNFNWLFYSSGAFFALTVSMGKSFPNAPQTLHFSLFYLYINNWSKSVAFMFDSH